MSTEKTFSPSVIAAMLGVRPVTVHRWIQDKVLTAVNVQRGQRRPTYRVFESTLVAFFRERGVSEAELRVLFRK